MAALVHDQRPHTNILEHRPDLNQALAAAIGNCLAANADDRPESADRFLWLIRGVESETE